MKTYASLAVLGLLLATPGLAAAQSSGSVDSGSSSRTGQSQSMEKAPDSAAGGGSGLVSGGSSSNQEATGAIGTREPTMPPSGNVAANPAATSGVDSSDSEQTAARPTTSRSAAATDKATVKQVQAQLQKDGYHVGKVDGVMGKQTRQALMKYQKDHGMQATGRIDKNTMAKMDLRTSSQTATTRSSSGMQTR